MPIHYACINQSGTKVAESPAGGGAHPEQTSILQRVLSTVKAEGTNQRKAVEDKDSGFTYFYMSDNNNGGMMVGCAATADVAMRTVFAFLEAVLTEGGTEDRGRGSKILHAKLEYFNDPLWEEKKQAAFRQELDDVKAHMMENIDKIVVRMEHDSSGREGHEALPPPDVFQKRERTSGRGKCVML